MDLCILGYRQSSLKVFMDFLSASEVHTASLITKDPSIHRSVIRRGNQQWSIGATTGCTVYD
jgi:hypothetical protein